MRVDSQLLFSDAQAVTSAAGSTNTIDLSAVRDIGTGRTLYLVVCIVTTLTHGGSNTSLAIAIEGDSTTTFTPDGTQTVLTILAASYTAGGVFIVALDPGAAPLQYQYIRLKYTPAGADLTGGTIDAFLTADVHKWSAYADAITIS